MHCYVNVTSVCEPSRGFAAIGALWFRLGSPDALTTFGGCPPGGENVASRASGASPPGGAGCAAGGLMEIKALRYVVTLAEELHFGKAAQRHFISAQPFGQQVRRLEREVGA